MIDTILSCKSCFKPVIIAETIAGEHFAVDAAPVEDGHLALEEARDGKVIAHNLAPGALNGLSCDRYRPHFATCRDTQAARR